MDGHVWLARLNQAIVFLILLPHVGQLIVISNLSKSFIASTGSSRLKMTPERLRDGHPSRRQHANGPHEADGE